MIDKSKVTLKDIAKELGISVSTASRALKAHPDIAKETVRAVKELAEKYQYVPNSLAISFRKKKTFNIGLVVPEIVHHFFSNIISGAIATANQSGYNVMVSQSNDVLQDEKAAVNAMLHSGVDGLLISISNETVLGEHIQELMHAGKPVVQMDKVTDHLKTPQVIVDDFDGAYQAVQHLIQNGYRKIAHFRGRPIVKNANQRYFGYLQALKDAGITPEKDWVKHCVQINEAEGYRFAKELLEGPNPPDAFFCITDLVALGVLRYLKEQKIEVPGEVGLMGFSNWKLAEISSPALSTVDQHGYEIGVRATQMLLDSLAGASISSDAITEIKTNLVIRESSGRKKVQQQTQEALVGNN
ncbi:LacI family DNA-binding transcriptional regulator [Nitritalea halalkaliphila]|nr:LacI family DNA-binding transcriptional regulator [Nitritalea halalkaliphila]